MDHESVAKPNEEPQLAVLNLGNTAPQRVVDVIQAGSVASCPAQLAERVIAIGLGAHAGRRRDSATVRVEGWCREIIGLGELMDRIVRARRGAARTLHFSNVL